MSLKKRQLTDVAKICDSNNLKYFLGYGTLLGAVRHKGFIPWDDDVDILMPRKDYEQLRKIWDRDNRYKLLDCRDDKKYIYPFMKVIDTKTKLEEHDVEEQADLGLYIDIFSYDGVSSDAEKRQAFLKKCERLEKLRLYSMLSMDKILHEDAKKNFGRKILWKVLRMIGPARISRKMEKFIAKNTVEDAEWMGCLCTRFSDREIMKKEIWEETIQLEFEGKMYKAPKEYDKMLTTNYGDYMTLPPEEKRCLAHNFKVWEYIEE